MKNYTFGRGIPRFSDLVGGGAYPLLGEVIFWGNSSWGTFLQNVGNIFAKLGDFFCKIGENICKFGGNYCVQNKGQIKKKRQFSKNKGFLFSK